MSYRDGVWRCDWCERELVEGTSFPNIYQACEPCYSDLEEEATVLTPLRDVARWRSSENVEREDARGQVAPSPETEGNTRNGGASFSLYDWLAFPVTASLISVVGGVLTFLALLDEVAPLLVVGLAVAILPWGFVYYDQARADSKSPVVAVVIALLWLVLSLALGGFGPMCDYQGLPC